MFPLIFRPSENQKTGSEPESDGWWYQSRKDENCSIFFWLWSISVTKMTSEIEILEENQNQKGIANHNTLFLTSCGGFRFISWLLIPLLTIWFSLQHFFWLVLWLWFRFLKLVIQCVKKDKKSQISKLSCTNQIYHLFA